jgi:predicted AAA+ superfamily ATPase
MHDKKTKQREINGLLDAMTAYHLKEGLILTDDESDSILIEDNKINMMPVWLWLLSIRPSKYIFYNFLKLLGSNSDSLLIG